MKTSTASVLAVVGWLAAPVHAVTFVVNSINDAVDAKPGDGVCATKSGACTLRAAMQEANALTGADAIMVPAGSFLLTIKGSDEEAAASGDLDITEDLSITGAGDGTTIISGYSSDRVFDVHAPATLHAADLTI